MKNMKAAIEPITIRSAAIGRHRDSRMAQDLKRPRDWFVIVENDYVLQL